MLLTFNVILGKRWVKSFRLALNTAADETSRAGSRSAGQRAGAARAGGSARLAVALLFPEVGLGYAG